MGEANVEVVRRMTEGVSAFWRGEGGWEETVGPFYEAGVDYYPVRKWPESRPCHGIEELRRFMEDWTEAWGSTDWEVVDIEDVSDARVVMRARFDLAGRGSGLGMSGEVRFIFWLRRGRIFRQEDHLTEAGVRRALDLDA